MTGSRRLRSQLRTAELISWITHRCFISSKDKVAIDEAKKCIETGEEKTIVFGLTGTGYFDLVAYEKFHDGKMSDYIPTDEELKASLDKLPKME